MKTISLFAAAAILAAGSAAASGISAGHAQLAALLGVSAQDYSLAELAQLDVARSDNDPVLEAFILSRGAQSDSGVVGSVSDGKAQLAAQLGVNAADYSLSDLAALAVARDGANE